MKKLLYPLTFYSLGVHVHEILKATFQHYAATFIKITLKIHRYYL